MSELCLLPAHWRKKVRPPLHKSDNKVDELTHFTSHLPETVLIKVRFFFRYHSCMCSCCTNTAGSGANNAGPRRYTTEFEPVAERPFDDLWERELTCVSKVKDKLHRFIQDQINCNRVPLCINPSSAAFKSFASSTVAHPSELPPSPHHWE